MKKITLLLSILLLTVFTARAQETKWIFDNTHSKIQFDVAHLVISEVTGQFNDYEGTIIVNKPDLYDIKIDFSIDVKSIDTDNEDRDNHLRSADFFNVEKYPKITFKSKSLKLIGDNQYKLTGNFTMLGVTKEITLDVKYGGTVKDPYGNTKAGFKITGVINRTDFGLKYNSIMDSGGLLLGEDITITCKIEFLKLN